MTFARFMAAPLGRGIRIAVGLALIAWGVTVHSTTGWVLVVIGLLPVAAGLFDWCLFAPLFGGPFNGRDVRH